MTTLIRHRFSVRRLPGPFRFPDVAPPAPGQILLLTGPSGSGKSTLLRQLTSCIPVAQRIHLNDLPLPNKPTVELLPHLPLEDRLRLLSRVGLAEVYSWLRTPRQLSDGQRYRLRLALALAKQTPSAASVLPGGPRATQTNPGTSPLATNNYQLATLLSDEFAAPLDILTALVVSQAIRKLVKTNPTLSAILVTGRHELIPALAPDRLIHCDFGRIEEIQPQHS
ncbi:MAG: ATP-binding cassette domain-containing protein [Tepidisphaeraceae bacterium]|jgi:ABC-type ATPase with predicted acetyltransferase domain